MLARILSGAVLGIDAYKVSLDIDVSRGLPYFYVVGLPDGAINEATKRIPAALRNANYDFPSATITVNLAPADVRKDGTALDLPMALGILAANETIATDVSDRLFSNYLFVGELSLDGEIRPIDGALSLATLVNDHDLEGIVLPSDNAREAAVAGDIDVVPVAHLNEVIDFAEGRSKPDGPVLSTEAADASDEFEIDFKDVAGQESAKRGLEIAAAGGHNVLLKGPPGSGKSMLAKRMPTILPEMSFREALETTKIYSATGRLPEGAGLISNRPYRSPHHTISDVGMVGGGSGVPKPGEVSYAHNGVLFLDELPEFRRNVLEVLRQPLEDGSVSISRSLTTLTYPANLMLIAAMNPCPCGYYGTDTECSCSARRVHRYRNKVSGPLMDRIDIQIEVPAVSYDKLKQARRGETSRTIRQRVEDARQRQTHRFDGSETTANANMNAPQLREHCEIDDQGHELLENAIDNLGMSARAYDRILKLARTIADLAGEASIEPAHLAEAIQYRSLDRENALLAEV